MAALDTPWLAQMLNPKVRPDSLEALATNPDPVSGAPPLTYAAFSPASLSTSTTTKNPSRSTAKRSTILVHQKSPLLLATPPQVTRALAYSHPFLLPLNKLAGLLTWTTGDPWESFLLLVSFWAMVIYGDIILRIAGPIVVVLGLIIGMYGRRFSPLSSSGWTTEPGPIGSTCAGIASAGSGKFGHKAAAATTTATTATTATTTTTATTAKSSGGAGDLHNSAHGKTMVPETTNTRHQKTLDEIVETLKEFTARCNMLLEPLLRLTDFLSTQRTPTSATVRPALTTLFIRILFCTPFWFILTLPPLRIITTRRIVMVFGSLILTWHSRPMRVARTLLWRSSTVRRTASLVTGLEFEVPLKPTTIGRSNSFQSTKSNGDPTQAVESELTKQLKDQSLHHKLSLPVPKSTQDAGVKFTFIIYENQRRWVGLGWTSNLFGYERAAWTDEHNTQVPARDEFELPDVEEDSRMRWRWVQGSRWKVDGVLPPEDGSFDIDYDGEAGKMGWVYYDNKWQNGRRGQDGWGRWTRRRKWYRDAELVDMDDGDFTASLPPQPQPPSTDRKLPTPLKPRTGSGGSSSTDCKSSSTLGYTVGEKMISPMRAETSLSTSRSPSIASFLHFQEGAGNDGEETAMSSSPRSFFKQPATLKRRSEQLRQSRALGGGDGDAGSETGSLLGLQTEMEIHGHNKDSKAWGIGDEAHMLLE